MARDDAAAIYFIMMSFVVALLAGGRFERPSRRLMPRLRAISDDTAEMGRCSRRRSDAVSFRADGEPHDWLIRFR